MGAMKDVLIDVEMTMLDASLLLSNAVCETDDTEVLMQTAMEVHQRMRTVIDLLRWMPL